MMTHFFRIVVIVGLTSVTNSGQISLCYLVVSSQLLLLGEKEKPQTHSVEGNIDFSLSASGKYVATLSRNGYIAVWDSKSRTKCTECAPKLFSSISSGKLSYDYDGATSLCFDSNKDCTVYFVNTQGIHAWDWKASRTPKLLVPYSMYTSSKASTPGLGNIAARLATTKKSSLAAMIDVYGNLAIVDLQQKHKPIVRLSNALLPDDLRNDVCFVPTSTKAIYLQRGQVKVLDVLSTDKQLQQLRGLHLLDNIEAIGISSSGNLLACSNSKGGVVIIDLSTQQHDHLLCGHKGSPCIAFSNDDKLFAIGDEAGVLSICSVKTRTKLSSIQGPASGFTKIGFFRENNMILGIGEFPCARYWRITKAHQLAEVKQ